MSQWAFNGMVLTFFIDIGGESTRGVVRGMAQAPFEIRPSTVVGIFVLVVGYVVGWTMIFSWQEAIRDSCDQWQISHYTCFSDQEGIAQYHYEILWIVLFIPFLLFFLLRVLRKNRCTSCGSAVPKSEITKTLQRKITAFSEGTQAVTSLNPALGLGASGRGGAIGIGATTSTSHTPVKLASYQCSVNCPKCEHTHYWTQNVKVRIWTSVEGVESVEDLEPVSYPFKMVK